MYEGDDKKKAKKVEKNTQTLMFICEQILNSVMNSFRFCPSTFRTIFHAISNAIIAKFPSDSSISRYTGLSLQNFAFI
jgi:hypothetical protein